MKRFAPVAPIGILENLFEAGVIFLGDYHLVIANDVLAEPQRWAKFFNELRSAWHGPVSIIVDNGVIETGVAMSPEKVATAAFIVGAQVVVLPDVIGKWKSTVAASKTAMKWYRKSRPDLLLMGVAQGATVEETVACLNELDLMGCDVLSVPKGTGERLGWSRSAMTATSARRSAKPYHVLGFTDDQFDDMKTVYAHDWVMGIDSAMPIWLGQLGIVMSETPVARQYGRRPPWSSVPTTITPATIKNLSFVKHWLRGESALGTLQARARILAQDAGFPAQVKD